MITSFFNIFIQILLVLVILSGMVLLLLGVGHLFRSDDQQEATDMLKDEMKREDDSIADHSLFRQFILSDHRKRETK